MTGGDAGSLLDRTEAGLEAGLDESDRGLDRCAEVVAALTESPARPIGDPAAALGISHGHLNREFPRVVGLSPRTLARVLRERRLLEQVDVHGRIAWTSLAAELGWYDQAHLIRPHPRRHPAHRRPAVGLRRGPAPLPAAGRGGTRIRAGGGVESVQDSLARAVIVRP